MGGVMIRGKTSTAIAVRKADGSINISSRPLINLYKGRWSEVPIIRGMIALIETLVLGIGTLMYSAQVLLEDEEAKVSTGVIWGSVIVGAVLAVALFFVLPLLIIRFFDAYIPSAFLSNLIEGAIRIFFFIVYLALIGRMKDIQEVFAYHGAEHMSVNAYERDNALDLESAKKHSTAHIRCGTSFLLIVLVLSILVFALLGRPSIWISIVLRIILIPLIAALSYEFIKFEANHSGNRFVRLILAPGLWLQSMTTRKPSEQQLEVGIAAMQKALETDGVILPGNVPVAT